MLIKVVIFCVSGLIIVPLLLRDCGVSYDSHILDSSRKPVHAYAASASKSSDAVRLMGIYVLDEASTTHLLKDRRDELNNIQSVRLYISMSNFSLYNAPYLIRGGSSRLQYMTLKGTWSTYMDIEHLRIHLRPEGTTENIRADLLDEEQPYRIRFTLGYASTNKPLTFVKIE